MLNKKIMLGVATLTALVSVGSYAATPGVYFGGQAGYGDVHQSSKFQGAQSKKDTGIAGRIFAGYQFDTNWGAELGYTKFSDATAKSTVIPGYDVKGTISTNAVDLVAKGTYPVANNVNLYGKLGVAYVAATGEIKFAGHKLGSENAHKVYPTAGVGVSYDFTPNLAADLSYNRIQKVGGTSTINSTDLVSVGLIYSIG